MEATEQVSKTPTGNGDGDAKANESNGKSESAEIKPADSSEKAREDFPWRKAKKVVVMLSFNGKNYLGMQR